MARYDNRAARAALIEAREDYVMVFQGVVHDGMVKLPAGVDLPDGTVVTLETPSGKRFQDVLDLAASWEGDDADLIVDEIYALRSSAPARATFDP